MTPLKRLMARPPILDVAPICWSIVAAPPGASKLRHPEVVDFDQANARASREQRGVESRWQCRDYARLEVVCRRQTGSGQLRGLSRVVLPVVIRDQKRSIAIAQF